MLYFNIILFNNKKKYIESLYRVHSSSFDQYVQDDHLRRFFLSKITYFHKRSRFPFFYSRNYYIRKICSVPLLISDHFFSFNLKLYISFIRISTLYTFLLVKYFVRSKFKIKSVFLFHLSYFFFIHYTLSSHLNVHFLSDRRMYTFNCFRLLSRNSSICLFRHFFLSFMPFLCSYYHFYYYISYNSSPLLSIYNNKLSSTKSIVFSFKYNYSILYFLFKFFYSYFLRSFISRFVKCDLLSDTFFFTLFTFVKHDRYISIFNSLLSLHKIRNSFFSFLSGRYSSRLFFFIVRSRSSFTISFFLWLLSRYHFLYMSVFFISIKVDFFFLAFSINMECQPLFLLLFSNLFMYKNAFSEMCLYLKKYTISIHSFLFSSSITFFLHNLLSINFFYFIYILRFFPTLLYLRKVLFNLTYQIEHSLFSYSGSRYFFSMRLYYKKYLPPITNSKMVCEYLILLLSFGYNLNRAFSKLRYWQRYWLRFQNRHSYTLTDIYSSHLRNCFYPLKGIRIICSGPPYKARRTIAKKYHLWVSNEFITGRMPLSTMDLHIDYYQSFVVLRRSNIGIKVWLLFDEVL